MDPNERHDPHAHHAHRHEHAHAGHPPPAAPAVANTAPPDDDDDAAAVTIYTCPMHPQIQSTELKQRACKPAKDEAWYERGVWAWSGRECAESSGARV